MVGVGQTVDLPVTLAIGALTETVNVTAASPIVDARQTGTATNVTIDELANIPTSRDPFSLLRSVNGVLVDRVNIGGNETGQQSNFVSKGTRPQDAVWTMDGVAITDMTLTGIVADLLQLRQLRRDPRLDRRPGDHAADRRRRDQLHRQARHQPVPRRRAATSTTTRWNRRTCRRSSRRRASRPETADHNKQISDYGGDIGGPLVRDKAWFYGSYSTQDVRLVRRTGTLVDARS